MLEHDDEDVKWVARCLRGDTSAFEPLVVKHQRVLFSVALRLVGNYEDARDATQNAFIRAFERLDTFDPERKFFSWIYRIAVNESLNLRRGRRVHEPLEATVQASAAQRDGAEAAELSEHVRDAIVALTPEQREVVILKYFAEMSYEEIGDALGLPEKTVKSRLFTARQQLGARLTTHAANAS
jgi:RNA polymerase sigma-70 factor (ECF subfamily)